MTPRPSPRHFDLQEKTQLMSASEIERTLVRLVHEIIEKNNGATDLGLVGIRRRGVFLAQRLGQMIGRIEKTQVPVGTLDITLYRDDLSTVGAAPVVQKTEAEFPVTGKNIVLVDDVLYTGRTVRAAMDALLSKDVPGRSSFACSSIADIANYPSKQLSWAAKCRLRGRRSLRFNCAKSMMPKKCWS